MALPVKAIAIAKSQFSILPSPDPNQPSQRQTLTLIDPLAEMPMKVHVCNQIRQRINYPLGKYSPLCTLCQSIAALALSPLNLKPVR